MATAEQIKALIKSYVSGNNEQFITVALQLAAHEARQGHANLAQEIRELVDKAKTKPKVVVKFPGELSGLIVSKAPDIPMEALVLDEETKERIKRIILEFKQQSKLKKHGLSHRRKVLLSGAPGTGKTMSAQVLATELNLTLHTIQMDRLVTKFMGETGAKLRQIFDHMHEFTGVYFFDEFDAIGGERSLDNDVGEMRRVLNAFLQFIENDTTDNLIIASTNNIRLLDRALFRRFDDVLHYSMPGQQERESLIANLLGTFRRKKFPLEKAAREANGLSHAEIDYACRDAIKQAILNSKNHISYNDFVLLIKERQEVYKGGEK